MHAPQHNDKSLKRHPDGENVAAGKPQPHRLKKKASAKSSQPFSTSPSEFGKFVIQYTEKWSKVTHAAGIKAG